MKVVVSAADSASLKEVSFSRYVDTNNKQSDAPEVEELLSSLDNGPKKPQAITHIAIREATKETAVVRKNGVVQLGEQELARLNSGSHAVGLFWGPNNTEHAGILLAFASDGKCLAINTSSGQISKFDIRPDISVVAQSSDAPLVFASAGEGSETLPDVFKLDLQNKSVEVEAVWQASEPPNNHLDLPEANLVTCLTFTDPNTLVAATSSGRMRVYDLLNSDAEATEKPGQPIEITQVSQYGIKSLVQDPTRPNCVILGDSRTTVSRWSIKPSKLLGHYKGVSGSTRALSTRGPYVALGGLDRYVRVFDIEKRQPAGKVYIGQEIWALVLSRQDNEEDIDDVDTLWNDLGLSKRTSRDAASAEKRVKVSSARKMSEPDSISKAEPETSDDDSEDDASEDDVSEDDVSEDDVSEDDVSEDTENEEYSDSFHGFD